MEECLVATLGYKIYGRKLLAEVCYLCLANPELNQEAIEFPFYNNFTNEKKNVLNFTFQRDLKKAEFHLSAERAKVDNRLQNMDFLKAKSEEFKLGIRVAEVCMKD